MERSSSRTRCSPRRRAPLDPSERRHWHARIARTAADTETRARHLAFARPGPDAGVAAQLRDAARAAVTGRAHGGRRLFTQALATLPRGADEGQGPRPIEPGSSPRPRPS